LLRGEHVALIGLGGVGKTSIAKAILHEGPIVSVYGSRRYFVPYDGQESTISYETFFARIAHALDIPTKTQTPRVVLSRLRAMKALLVLENAETFLEARRGESGRILEAISEIGAQESVQILLTTRNRESISHNFAFRHILVEGLTSDAARKAFASIYQRAPVDAAIDAVLLALAYHPLSINILANAAMENEWKTEEGRVIWEERRSKTPDSGDDKSRSLRVTIEASLRSAVFKDTYAIMLRLLQSIALLPQGIHRDDLGFLFQGIPAISIIAESTARCCLTHRQDNRFTMLAPVRVYLMDNYNTRLSYDDELLTNLRHWYFRPHKLESEWAERIRRESANSENLLSVYLTSEQVKMHASLRLQVLTAICIFLEGLGHHNPQPTRLFALLENVSE